MGDELPGQVLWAGPVKALQLLPQPPVIPRAADAVADHQHRVPRGQAQGEAVRDRVLPGGQPGGQGGAGQPLHRPAAFDIGGGGPQLIELPVPGEQVDLQKVHRGKAPGILPPQGQGGGQGAQRLTGGDPGLQKLFQQAHRQGALPVGLRPAAHAVAQQDVQRPIGPLEIGPCIAADRLSTLPLGGHPGHRHQGLLLDEGQAALSPALQTQGHPQQGGQLTQALRPGQSGAAGALRLQMEQPPAVPEDRRAYLQSQLGRHLPQAALSRQVGGQLPAQLCGRRVEQFRQLGVLLTDSGPALPHPGVILPPVQQSGQLPVHRRHIGGEVEAPVGKIPGEILRQGAAPGHHGGGGVVHGVEGGGVVLLPAPVPQGAAPAQLSGGPVKNDGHVVVVPGRAKGGAQGLGQGAKGGGGRLQLPLDQALSAQASGAG